MKEIYTTMEDGHPYTYSGWTYSKPGHRFYRLKESRRDDSCLLVDLPKDKQREVLNTLSKWFVKSNKTTLRHTSYGYKHWLEDEVGHYISNNQLKDAMLELGFEPSNYDELNWCFKVKPTATLKKWLEEREMRW